jgi:hypothetical protein
MATSQNGYEVLYDNRTTGPLPRMRKLVIPLASGEERHFYVRDGSVALHLGTFALWWHERLEPINVGTWDEWGWAVRPIRGQTSGYSNHASGTAIDINATEHPRGVATSRTFTPDEVARIHLRLRWHEGVLRWGGDYQSTPDGMHVEINLPLSEVERVAQEKLVDSRRGKRILAANPGLLAVVMS